MAFQAGKDSVFKIDDSGGTLRDISAYVRSVSFPREVEALETTAFGKSAKTYIVGLADATISIEGMYDSTATTGPDAVLSASPATTRTFEYGPEGGTTGKIRYTGECILTSYEPSGAVDGVVEFSAEFQVTDTVTRNTY